MKQFGNLTENKEFAEQAARNLRCSGVMSARVIEVIAYKVVTDGEKSVVKEENKTDCW